MKRFLDKFEKGDGCWLWKGSINNHGYGRFKLMRYNIPAHRFSWEFFRGEVPRCRFVLHHCDVRNCVNPDHLYLGTHKDNMRDVADRGRMSGERNPSAKITVRDVLEIRKMSAKGISNAEIAKAYPINPTSINNIVTRKTWSHA